MPTSSRCFLPKKFDKPNHSNMEKQKSISMSKNTELIYTVDESGNLLNLESREDLHLAKSSKRHAAVIGMILRKDGKFLIQWRASKQVRRKQTGRICDDACKER